MEQRLSLVTLGVENLSASIAFYDQLGWVRAMQHLDGVAFYQLGGIILALYPIKDLARDAGISPRRSGFSGVALAYNTRTRDEVDRVLDEAVAAGAQLLKPGAEAAWGGYIGHFADPDGHVWEVAWNPDFPIDDVGNIRLPG